MDLVGVNFLRLLVNAAHVADWLVRQILVFDPRDYHWVHKSISLGQLLDLELIFGAHFIKHHILSQNAGEGKSLDI